MEYNTHSWVALAATTVAAATSRSRLQPGARRCSLALAAAQSLVALQPGAPAHVSTGPWLDGWQPEVPVVLGHRFRSPGSQANGSKESTRRNWQLYCSIFVIPPMDEVRIRDSSISRNIDLYLEELKCEQAAREKLNAERDRSQLQNERTGNGAVSLDDREGAGGENEEGWEEEYVMLDLDDVFHGALVPNFAYTLSGLDTLNPILTLDNGLKLIGHYVETMGTVVVYSEKEKEAQAGRGELPPPADPDSVNNEKRPRKRIRGVCKLERKLKFCAMPIASAPASNGMSMGDVSFMKTTATEDASRGNAMQTQDGMPTENASPNDARPTENTSLDYARATENASLDDARLTEDKPLEDTRPMEDAPLESARPTEDGASENAMSTEDALHRNAILMYDTSVEIAKLGEDVSLENTRPAEDVPLENVRLMESVSHENARPEGDATLKIARTVEDASFGNAIPTEDTSSK